MLSVVNCKLWKFRLNSLTKLNLLIRNFNHRRQSSIIKQSLQMYKEMATIAENSFIGNKDRFDGVTVDSDVEDCRIEDFPQKLENSLKEWMKNSKRGIWFKVALRHSDWVPILAKNGFDFHHARNGFVTMYKWLPENENCNIPPYSHTMIGVGAVVVNDNNQILVVREKYWNIPHWKLPGGYVEPGENIIDAAIREVFEETNIQTEFQSVLNMRHAHNAMFDCSDIYFVVSLKPLSHDISKCEREIVACEWLDIDEYLNHPNVHELNRFFVQTYVNYDKSKMKIDCEHGIHQILKKPYTVYFAKDNNCI